MNIQSRFCLSFATVFLIALSTCAIAQTPDQMPKPKGLVIESLENQPVPEHLKEMARNEYKQMREQGFADAPEEAVAELDRYLLPKNKERLKTMDELRQVLLIQPADLTGTPFAAAEFIGGVTMGVAVEDKWTGIARLFKVRSLGIIKLEEWDFTATDGGIIFAKEFINEDINGIPAILVAKESLSGKTMTEVTWVTDKKVYTLTSSHKLLRNDKKRDEFLALARSLYN